MTDTMLPQFTLENYPKSYGSIEQWRLHDYLHLAENEQHLIYKQLEQFCLNQAASTQAVSQFKEYPLVGMGWEWSVFAKNETTVLKIPAGIFPEVNTIEYLDNVQRGYELIRRYYPPDMVADTIFFRDEDINMVEQVRLSGRDWNPINFDQADEWLLGKLRLFFASTLSLIHEQQWLPDFWLNHDPNGFILRNVMVDPSTDQFAIIDFTSYLDPARMYPALCQQHCQSNEVRVKQMLGAVEQALVRIVEVGSE